MAKEFNKVSLQKKAIKEAWKKVSREFLWTESLLEKYQDKVDWYEVSSNWQMVWTIPIVQKFKERIDWHALSGHIHITETFLELFKDELDWSELSCSINIREEISDELLEKYADKWDWEMIINHWDINLFNKKGEEFYTKFKNHIPVSKLYKSRLWDVIIDQQKKQLIEEITA